MIIERPEIVEDEHLTYLDDLRESGVTNMLEGNVYLEKRFNLSNRDASNVLVYWMKSFAERHKSSVLKVDDSKDE